MKRRLGYGAGGKIEVWAWRKLKRRVDNRHWHPRITEVTLTMLEAAKAASDL